MRFVLDVRGCATGFRLWVVTRRGEHPVPGVFTTLTAVARAASAATVALRENP